MPANFQLILDTLGPQDVEIVLTGASTAIDPEVGVAVTTSDPDTTGYQVKFWGDVVGAPDEATATWEMLAGSNTVIVTAGDDVKTIHARLRDDVWNESAAVQVAVTLDTTGPFISILAGPDVPKVSKVDGKNLAVVTWSSETSFDHYEVRVVPDLNSDHTAGTLIASDVGDSENVEGDGAFAADEAITTIIDGRDLEAASPGDGPKVIKVFALDEAGNWSV